MLGYYRENTIVSRENTKEYEGNSGKLMLG